MPRLPYLPLDLVEPKAVVDAVRARRGGTLLNLDRILLYSPVLTQGWGQLLGAIRTQLSLDPKLRELAMCVVASINNAPYEFGHHAPLYIGAGATSQQAEALKDPVAALGNPALEYSPAELAALAMSIELTRDVNISEATFAKAKSLLNEQSLVELVATIGAYNMVSRFLVAFGVEPE
jgi:alkylhydroperoxidase family enzyme